jgi:polyisoprenoid-binding protein YceI
MRTKPDHATTTTTPRLGRYEIDTSSSTVTFRTRHLFGLGPVRGAFGISAGTIDVAEPLAESGISAQIETASFRTGNDQRDGAVRSARFLDAGQYPVMSFISQGLDGPALAGALTVRDVTRPVSLSVELSAVSPRSFTARATTRIDRTEFGVTAARGLAGRYLDVTLEVQCVRK